EALAGFGSDALPELFGVRRRAGRGSATLDVLGDVFERVAADLGNLHPVVGRHVRYGEPDLRGQAEQHAADLHGEPGPALPDLLDRDDLPALLGELHLLELALRLGQASLLGRQGRPAVAVGAAGGLVAEPVDVEV